MENQNSKSPTITPFEIVEKISTIQIPDAVMEDTDFNKLLESLQSDSKKAEDKLKKITDLKTQKEERWAITNWVASYTGISDLKAIIAEESSQLGTIVAQLTKNSVQLLIINTALSKVACDQQKTLLNQQDLLDASAESIKDDMQRAYNKQLLVEDMQRDFNKDIGDILLKVNSLKTMTDSEVLLKKLENDIVHKNTKATYQIIIVGLLALVSIVIQFIRH